MTTTKNPTTNSLTLALEAIGNLTLRGLNNILSGGYAAALVAHTEIRMRASIQKSNPFYNHFLPLRRDIVAVLAENYRRYFKLALAHPAQTEGHPEKWAWHQLQPAVGAALEWIPEWFILACEGENRYVRRAGSIQFAPGQTASLPIPLTVAPSPPPQSWRAPSWLFQISIALVGIGFVKTARVPSNNSEEKLSAAHTRLLLKGARRVFLWELGAAIQKVRDEETAVAGAISTQPVNVPSPRINKRTGWQQKRKLYKAIQKILNRNPKAQGIDFCAELDKHHAPPLYDWTKRKEWRDGLTWKEAWDNHALRRKIRRVRQEAMKSR